MDYNKIARLIFGAFAGIGLICILFGLAFFLPRLLDPDRVETTGTVTEVRGDDTYVAYTVNGTAYEAGLNGYSTAYYPGKEISIYYDRNEPEQIGSPGLDLLLLIPAGIGLLFVLMGGVGLLSLARGGRKAESLRDTGRKVYADYVETVVNYAYTVNGRHPYRVICRWRNPEDGNTYLFKSGNLWTNPDAVISLRGITAFPVYLDPKHKKRYTVDTDSVTQNVVDLT